MLSLKLCFVLCVLRSSFAAVPDVQKLAEDVQDAVAHVLGDLEPAGHNHTKANRWIFAVLRQVDSEDYVNAMVAKIASINDVSLSAELVSLADGYHLIIPKGQEGVENEHRVLAIATINMLTNLKTMERVDTIIANCSLSSTYDILFNGTDSLIFDEETAGNKGAEHIKALFDHWLESIVSIIENDPRLNKEFAKQKDEAEAVVKENPIEVSSPLDLSEGLETKMAKKIMSSQLFRRTALNRIFLRQSNLHVESIDTDVDRELFLFSRALIDSAKHDRALKLTELYQKVLVDVADAVSESDVMEEMRDKLFSQLRKKVEEDEELKKHVKEVENKLKVWISFRSLRRSLAMV